MPGAETFRGSGDAYDRLMGRYARLLAPQLIAFAGVADGMRALDVGCGPGGLTAALVERLGADNVSAAEPSEPFAQAARERLPGVEVVIAPAEELPFDDDSFDVALSQLVVNFMRDAETGVRQMVRVTRPGGTVASCLWDYAGKMTLLRTFWDAAYDVDSGRAEAADEGRVMRWSSEEGLAQLWGAAGLSEIRTGELVVTESYSDFEDIWQPFLAGIGPSGAFVSSLDDDDRAALREAFFHRLGEPDGPFDLTALAWAVAGRV